MTGSKFPCKNHPEKKVGRRCFQCKEYICSQCQKHILHHIFCSFKCLFLYVISEKISKNRFLRDYALLIIIFLVIQFIFFQIYHLDKRQSPSIKQKEYNAPLLYQPAMSASSNLLIDTTQNELIRSISISGFGEENQLYGLWHNGKLVTSAVQSRKKFVFPAQTMYLGDNEFIVWALTQSGRTTMIDSFSIHYNSHRIEILSRPFEGLLTDEKILSLTFDAGSAANGADSIINILETKNIKSTIFLTGTFIKRFPHIVEKLRLNGNELANHTFSHPHLTTYSQNGRHQLLEHVDRFFVYSQLQRTDSMYHDLFNEHLKPYWRAPFGEYNQEILKWAAEAGFKHVGWSRGCDTRDWVSNKDSELYHTNQEIYEHLIDLESKGMLRGAVILFHLHTERKDDKPFKILSKLIDTLLKKNYQIVPISKLLTSQLIS